MNRSLIMPMLEPGSYGSISGYLEKVGVAVVPKGVSLSPLLEQVGVELGLAFFDGLTFYWQLIKFHFFSDCTMVVFTNFTFTFANMSKKTRQMKEVSCF